MAQAMKNQSIPLFLTVVTTACLCLILFGFLAALNRLPLSGHIQLVLHPGDILIGMTIYLKTSIDFAILIGNLMKTNPGWRKRIAIEIGTALGNALGTLAILAIWFFFKEAPILMICMIILATLVLLKMAEEGLGEFIQQPRYGKITRLVTLINKSLYKFNHVFTPVISRILPHAGITQTEKLPFFPLLTLSCSVPFILGLDDFAGYIPLFSLVNVFSFCIGIFLAHMMLNLALFAFPKRTTQTVSHPFIVVGGSFAFIGIALWGLYEAFRILLTLL